MTRRPGTTELLPGGRILTAGGYRLIEHVGRHHVTTQSSTGQSEEIPYEKFEGTQVVDGVSVATTTALEPWWSGLGEAVRQEALRRLEIVQEILTGYRWGHPRLAQPGEPFAPFGDGATSLTKRCARMARQLTFEQRQDRLMVRRVLDGELRDTPVSPRTVQSWIKKYDDLGLRGLVDGRATRERNRFEDLDPRVIDAVDAVFARFDGTQSRVNTTTVEADVRRLLREGGDSQPEIPERLFQEYLSSRQRHLGSTTRSHRTRHVQRKASGHSSYPALHPSHLAIDATRADVLVWDELRERALSVEVITALSVSTRVVVGLRVTPRSVNALEAGLVLYDAMRPMSMLVEGTSVDDFRWCGVPESLDLSTVAVHRSPARVIPPGQDLQGVHHKPGVRPSSIRCDHGSVFLSDHFTGLLRDFGIDLMLSRGSKPNDNPHIERFHETLQRAYQAIPGYKGRNPSERGRKVGSDDQPLLTASELERHLHRFIALDYHRAWHQGLVLPGAPSARLTPLEMWDALMDVTGRITVPQHPDLIYQFLPIRWLTVGHAGVEYKNLTYDSPTLNDFRVVRPSTFQHGTSKVPFHYDPRDITRLWFRHPDTEQVHEVPWKAQHLQDLPLGEAVLDRALNRIRERGGNSRLQPKSTWRQIVAEIRQLTTVEETADARARGYANRERWNRAQRDHAEAADAAKLLTEMSDGVVTPLRRSAGASRGGGQGSDRPRLDEDEIWPDYQQPRD